MNCKKIVSVLLASSMLVSAFSVLSYATTDSEENLVSIESKIAERKQIIYDDVYRQLQEQNAEVLFDTYKEILAPQIEEEAYYLYGQELNSDFLAGRSASYNFTYGGLVTYLKPVSGAKPTEVAVLNLDKDNSYAYVLKSSSFTIKSLIEAILGFIPNLGAVSSIVLTANSIADKPAYNRIYDAGGYAQIINTYSHEYGTKASVVTGWYAHPSYSTPNDAYSITTKAFSYHNPFQ